MHVSNTFDYAALNIGDCLRFTSGDFATGAHVECDADNRTANRVALSDAARRAMWPQMQIAALRANPNSGYLTRIEHEIMFAIGADVCKRHSKEDDAHERQTAIWNAAMSNMQSFYRLATKRKANDYAV